MFCCFCSGMLLCISDSSWQFNLFYEYHYTAYSDYTVYLQILHLMGSCQRGAILGDNLSESSTLVHWNGVKWLLWVSKLAVDSELLDNVLVSVSDCATALMVWWRSGLTLTLFQPLLCEFSAFQMPVCKWTWHQCARGHLNW